MSASPLIVRLSDVRYIEQELDRLMEKQNHSNGGKESSISVKDARQRFEQFTVPNSAPNTLVRESAKPTHLDRTSAGSQAFSSLPKKKPIKKPVPVSIPKDGSSSVAGGRKSSESNQKGQSSPEKSCDDVVSSVSNKSVSQEVSSSSSGAKAKFKNKSLKQVLRRNISSGADNSSEPSSAVGGTATTDSKLTSATKKLFKRKIPSMEKNKVGAIAEHTTYNGSDSTNNAKENSKCGQGDETMGSQSPGSSKKKGSPLLNDKQRASPSSPSRSHPSSPSSIHSSASTTSKQGGHVVPFVKSFSDRILTCPREEDAVYGTLKRRGGKEKGSEKGEVAEYSRPASPRVIEDKELKLTISKGKTQVIGIIISESNF